MASTVVNLGITFEILTETVSKLTIAEKYRLIDVLDYEIAKSESSDPALQKYIEKVRRELEEGVFKLKGLED